MKFAKLALALDRLAALLSSPTFAGGIRRPLCWHQL
jgi:hypothetical protein